MPWPERQIETKVKFCLEATGLMLSKRKAKPDRREINHVLSQDCFTRPKMNAGIHVCWKSFQGIDTSSMKPIQKSRIQQRTKLVPHRGESKECGFVRLKGSAGSPRLRSAHPPDTCTPDSNDSAEPQPVYPIYPLRFCCFWPAPSSCSPNPS